MKSHPRVGFPGRRRARELIPALRLFPLWAVALCVGGCTPKANVPDICDMPPGFRSWNGAEVSWSGFVVGEPHHGYALACESHRGGIRLDWNDNTVGRERFEDALERTLFRPGVLRIKVDGRLGIYDDRPILRIEAVRRMTFTAMSEAEMRNFREGH